MNKSNMVPSCSLHWTCRLSPCAHDFTQLAFHLAFYLLLWIILSCSLNTELFKFRTCMSSFTLDSHRSGWGLSDWGGCLKTDECLAAIRSFWIIYFVLKNFSATRDLWMRLWSVHSSVLRSEWNFAYRTEVITRLSKTANATKQLNVLYCIVIWIGG